MKNWVLRYRFHLVGGLIGAVAGFVYWKYWGCVHGCAITSSPRNSTIYFAILGALLFSMLKPERKTQ